MLSTNFADGAPVWVDLGAPDVARTAGFYGSVFGWQADDLAGRRLALAV